jgi:hypothetical protein
MYEMRQNTRRRRRRRRRKEEKDSNTQRLPPVSGTENEELVGRDNAFGQFDVLIVKRDGSLSIAT